MSVTGDFGKLTQLIAAVGTLGPTAMSGLSKALAAEAESLVMQGFSGSHAPDGTAWAPLKLRQGQPLLNTGAHLRGSFTSVASPNSVSLGFGFAFAGVQNYGATIRAKRKALRIPFGGSRGGAGKGVKFMFARKVTIPARPMLPAEGHMPALWGASLEDAAREAMTRIVGSLIAAE